MTREPLTRQTAFDTAVAGLAAQGFRRSVTGSFGQSSCVYRGPDETRCAVGHCIPDEVYTHRMEGSQALELLQHYPSVRDLFADEVEAPFLQRLQLCHDKSNGPEDMRERLMNFGVLSRLTLPDVLTT